MQADIIDVESFALEESQENEERKACRLLAKDGKITMELNGSYYVLSAELASAYGLSMIIFGYLEAHSMYNPEGETRIDYEVLGEAFNWAVKNQSELSDQSSSLKVEPIAA